MISTNDMRPGQTLDLDGELYNIVKYEHHKPGKGGAMVRTKLKSIKNGALVDRTFRADEKVNLARLDKREMQYLYSDESGFVFMDNETYEQITIDRDFLGDLAGYLKEEQVVTVQLHAGRGALVELHGHHLLLLEVAGQVAEEVAVDGDLFVGLVVHEH
ncbi:MAG TPA: elongation factor P, partial [Actinomycetota bacterium]|nr:elongation factor P [Actinomycetota bacterium]